MSRPPVALIAGCGELGTLIGERLAEGWRVIGLRRRPEALPAAIEPLAADLATGEGLSALPAALEAVVFCAAPLVRTPETYRETYLLGSRNLLDALAAREIRPARAIFVSSTSVYGDLGGAWADEDTPPAPDSYQGEVLLAAEALWRERLPHCIIARLSGLYGPRRRWLIQRLHEAHPVCRRGVYTNRIHIEDAAAAIVHLLKLPEPEPLYVLSDDTPSPECEVMAWLAQQLGRPPPAVDELGARLPTGNKRLRNQRLRASGFVLRYPSYREGYGAILGEDRDRAR